MTKKRVLLVKEPKGNDNEDTSEQTLDPYAAALSRIYEIDFLPALGHRLTNYDKLREIQIAGSKNAFSGVVFTSKRAVEAWITASQAIDGPNHINPNPGWGDLPFYVVGPATAHALIKSSSAYVPPESGILGEGSGNAEQLALFICATHRTTTTPLLYLVGDKRRVTIVNMLKDANIPLVELEVYETAPSPTFDDDFRALPRHPYDWIVFFSPSGAKLVHEHRKALSRDVKFAAIGPTTRVYLADLPELPVSAMAESPTPESLLQALIEADK